MQRPSPEAIELVGLAANGDIRNALNNLQFLVKEGDKDSALIQYSILADANKSKKKGRKDKNPRLNNADLSVIFHLAICSKVQQGGVHWRPRSFVVSLPCLGQSSVQQTLVSFFCSHRL